ncbi:MAG: tetratricopeptide repeat protein, partial [Caldilineaceae bacterium]
GCTMPDGTVYTFDFDASGDGVQSTGQLPVTGYARKGTVVEAADLREGPDIGSSVSGAANPGDELVVVGADADQFAYLLDSGQWIPQDRVELGGQESMPVLTAEDMPDGFVPADELDTFSLEMGFQLGDPNVGVFAFVEDEGFQYWMIYGFTNGRLSQMEMDSIDADLQDGDLVAESFLGSLSGANLEHEILEINDLGDSAAGIEASGDLNGAPAQIGVVVFRLLDIWAMVFSVGISAGLQPPKQQVATEDLAATLAQKLEDYNSQMNPPVVVWPLQDRVGEGAASAEPQRAETFVDQGIALLESGYNARAIAKFDDAIELDSEYADAYVQRGMAYASFDESESNDYEQAISDLEKALELGVNSAEAYYYLGLAIFGARGADRQALANFEKALELKPDYADAYYYRGLVFANFDDLDRAIEDLDRAIALDPSLEHAFYWRGRIHADMLEDYDQAIKDYDEAVKLNPEYVAAYSDRGQVYAILEEYDNALDDFDAALRLEPDHIYALQGRAMASKELGDYGAVARDCSAALEASGGYLMPIQLCLSMMTTISERDFGDAAAAVESYDQAIEMDPQLAMAYLLRGFAKWALGDVEGAVHDMETALSIDPMLYIHILIPVWDQAFDNPSDPAVVIEELKAAREYLEPGSSLSYSIESTLETLEAGE